MSAARSAASAARDVSKPEPLEHYFRWAVAWSDTGRHRQFRPDRIPQHLHVPRWERNSDDHERPGLDRGDGFPRKNELSFGGDDPPVVMEYYDFNADDIKIEAPKCDAMGK